MLPYMPLPRLRQNASISGTLYMTLQLLRLKDGGLGLIIPSPSRRLGMRLGRILVDGKRQAAFDSNRL